MYNLVDYVLYIQYIIHKKNSALVLVYSRYICTYLYIYYTYFTTKLLRIIPTNYSQTFE